MRLPALLLSISVSVAPAGQSAGEGVAAADPGPDMGSDVGPAVDPEVAALPLDRDADPLPFSQTRVVGPSDNYVPLLDSPEARRARRWVNAGIGSALAGGLLVGGALAMGLQDPCAAGWGNNCFEDARDRAALTMGVPGGVLLLGGAAMITYGAIVRRQLWLGERPVAITPVFVPGRAGVMFTARF